MLNLTTICHDVAAAGSWSQTQLSRAWDMKGLPLASTPEAAPTASLSPNLSP